MDAGSHVQGADVIPMVLDQPTGADSNSPGLPSDVVDNVDLHGASISHALTTHAIHGTSFAAHASGTTVVGLPTAAHHSANTVGHGTHAHALTTHAVLGSASAAHALGTTVPGLPTAARQKVRCLPFIGKERLTRA